MSIPGVAEAREAIRLSGGEPFGQVVVWTCGVRPCPCGGRCACLGSADESGGVCVRCRTLLSRRPWAPSLPEVAPAFAAYLAMHQGDDKGGRWGALASALVENCTNPGIVIAYFTAKEAGDDDAMKLARILYALSPTQRAKLCRMELR